MTLLIVFVGIIAFCNLLLLLSIAYMALSMGKLVRQSVMPAVDQVQRTVKNVDALVDRIEGKAEEIMNVGEDTVRKVSDRVVATTDLAQGTITTPLITLSSVVAGISKAIQTWRRTS